MIKRRGRDKGEAGWENAQLHVIHVTNSLNGRLKLVTLAKLQHPLCTSAISFPAVIRYYGIWRSKSKNCSEKRLHSSMALNFARELGSAANVT